MNLKNKINDFLKDNKRPSRSIKTNKELWNEIIENTSFLESSAGFYQRVHHIFNSNDIPVCKKCNEPKKWINRGKDSNYSKYCSCSSNIDKSFKEIPEDILLIQIDNFLNNCTSKRPLVSLKANKELYNNIVFRTNYLPDEVAQVQRLYHLQNGHFTAICTECGSKNMKFYMGEYRKTCSSSCSMKQQNRDYLKNYNSEHGTEYHNISSIPEVKNNKIKSSLEKYGTDNPSKSKTIKNKISKIQKSKTLEEKKEIKQKQLQTKIKNGTIVEQTIEKDNYYREVWTITKHYYNTFIEKIDPLKLRSFEFQLDHIFSISEGYKNKIPAEIIGHSSNLQIIKGDDNLKKREKCNKTKNALYYDYMTNKFNKPKY